MDDLRTGGVLHLEVHRPIKSSDRYEFRCDVVGQPLTPAIALGRMKAIIKGYGSPFTTRLQFGFRALNFSIAHCDVWDSVFPLMFLIRNEGPLFNTPYDTAVIRFRYPILERVREFIVRRATNMGLSITVEGETMDRTYDVPGRGHLVSFGGGKDSRLLFGLLRELGRSPRLAETGFEYSAGDVPSQRAQPFRGVLAERVLPGLMAGAAHLHIGSSLAEAHFHDPWHQYYDLSSPFAQRELTDLLQSLGVEVTMHAPLCIAPPNVIQRALASRYSDLHRHQRSALPGARTGKNLQLAVLQLFHDLPFVAHCRDDDFRPLLREFVSHTLAHPDDFGFRNARIIFRREMRAILWRLRRHALLSEVCSHIPPEWDEPWIDFLHPYVNPDVDPAVAEILLEYAGDYSPAPGDYRIRVPGTVSAV